MTTPGPILILTGAGISRESGLHTFRDPDGIQVELIRQPLMEMPESAPVEAD